MSLLSLWLLLGTGTITPAPATDPNPAIEAAPVPGQLTEASIAAGEREPVDPDSARLPPADAPVEVRIRGRCIAAESGLPLAGCEIQLTGSILFFFHPRGPTAVTGPDGLFDVTFSAQPGQRYQLTIEAEGRVPENAWRELQPDRIEDLGDIPLHAGYPVSGQVMDELGVPVSGVMVSANGLPAALAEPVFAMGGSSTGHSDGDGRFALGVLPAGSWPLDTYATGFRQVSPGHVIVREGTGADPLEVVVSRADSISGVVVDQLGMPIEGVKLNLELDRARRVPTTETDPRGAFLIRAVDRDPPPARLRVTDGPVEPDLVGPFDWGRSDIRVTLKRTLSFELTVVEAGTGRPVERFAVICAPENGGSSLYFAPRLSGSHPGGRVTVDGVRRGTNHVMVLPEEPLLESSEVVAVEASETGILPVVIHLQPMDHVPVKVIEASGEGVAGSRVELIRPGTRELNAAVPATDYRSDVTMGLRPPRDHELVSEVLVDTEGSGLLAFPRDVSGLALRVTGTHPARILRDVRAPEPGGVLRIQVASGASVQGRVLLHGMEPRMLSVLLLGSDRPQVGPVEVGEDGGFEFHGVAPGDYDAYLVIKAEYRERNRVSFMGFPKESSGVDVTLEEGQTAEIALDAAPFQPGTLRGTVLMDGVPIREGRIVVESESGIRYGQFLPGDGGTFTGTGIHPGPYHLSLILGTPGSNDLVRVNSTESFEILPGQETERVFHFVRRVLEVRILAEDGTPVRYLRVQVLGKGREAAFETTDEEGILVLDYAPLTELSLSPAGVEGTLGSVAMPEGETRGRIDLTLKRQ